MTTKGIYIYGIIPNFHSTEMFRSLESSGIYAVSFQNISAIVSDRDSLYINYLDRESLGHLLVQHQKTIEDLQHKGFSMIVPMRLGTVVGSKIEVSRILENGYELIIETLKKIEYLTEVDVVVTWDDFPAVLRNISGHPDIMDLKAEIQKKAGEVSQVDQVKTGMMIHEKLEEKNKSVELKILEALSPFGPDIRMHEVMNDEMITNSAFLVNRNKMGKFELAVDKLDEEFHGALKFKIVGPLPCYSFYTLEVEELNPDDVERARNELGLPEETTVAQIKKAYLGNAKLFHPDTDTGVRDDANFTRINRAYHTLMNYSSLAKQTSSEEIISLVKERVNENVILVKIKE